VDPTDITGICNWDMGMGMGMGINENALLINEISTSLSSRGSSDFKAYIKCKKWDPGSLLVTTVYIAVTRHRR
jgi:hypothetical protein